MQGKFLLPSRETLHELNIYSDKSSLVLEWLLLKGVEQQVFSIREVSRETKASIGLVQRIFKILTLNGYLQTKGLRTTKQFSLKKPEQLLKNWIQNYTLVKKCKMWTYRSGFQGRKELLRALAKAKLQKNVVFALHSAAEELGCKNTNLQTLELYLLEPDIRPKVEKALQLESQERGYEVLLITPYYKSMLSREEQTFSPPLLTFLDLYHFPLRGHEQAEFLAERIPELNRIYKR